MKTAFKFIFLTLFLGFTGFANANTTNPIPETAYETEENCDEITPLRIRVCWTTKKGKRRCITVSTSRSLKIDELKVSANPGSGDRFIIFSGFPKELDGSSLRIPSSDSGFVNEEGKLYLRSGSYRVSRGSLKIPTVLKR